jgi:adenine/guanine/hypoxanthine permease
MSEPAPIAATPWVRLFVNGTLMRGEPLHDNLAGATYRGSIRTAPRYRLMSVRDVHPAMIRVTADDGVAVAGELYDLSLSQLQNVLEHEPPGLGLGVVNLEGGLLCLGICWTAPDLPAHSLDISSHGGWREYGNARRDRSAD